jgi:hypothetical protein
LSEKTIFQGTHKSSLLYFVHQFSTSSHFTSANTYSLFVTKIIPVALAYPAIIIAQSSFQYPPDSVQSAVNKGWAKVDRSCPSTSCQLGVIFCLYGFVSQPVSTKAAHPGKSIEEAQGENAPLFSDP